MTKKTITACIILLSIFCNIAAKNKETKEKLVNPYPHILIKDMTVDQLEEVLNYGKKINDKELIFKAYSLLFSKAKDPETLKVHKLGCADYCFSIEDYEKAIIVYQEFALLFPGSDQAEYAEYKLIASSFLMSLSYQKDQTETNHTISLCLLFLQRAKTEKFIEETKQIYQTCRMRLFQHEAYIFETYLKLLKFSSAKKRLEYMTTEFTDIAHHQKYIDHCTEKLHTFENPKTRPFYIQLNLEAAICSTDKKTDQKAIQHTASFFLA